MGDPGPAAGVINGPDEARKAVRQRYKDGADLIKITATGGVLSVAKMEAAHNSRKRKSKQLLKRQRTMDMQLPRMRTEPKA